MPSPAPESITTSTSTLSARPLKRRALTPISQQADQVEALFSKPDQEIKITGPTQKTLPAPPEIVANVQGSSAGAGSGEFHVYKASRRREYERLRLMDEEVEKEQADREFREKMEAKKRADEEKTNKNKKRREKRKKGKGGKGSAEPEDGQVKKARRDVVMPDMQRAEDGEDGGEVKAVEEVGVVIHDDD